MLEAAFFGISRGLLRAYSRGLELRVRSPCNVDANGNYPPSSLLSDFILGGRAGESVGVVLSLYDTCTEPYEPVNCPQQSRRENT